MQDDTNPAPALALSKKQLAKERRKKKNKARKQACNVPNLKPSPSTNIMRSQAAKILASDLEGLQEALPPIPPPAIPAALPVDPATGLQITFTATLASHAKPASR